MSIKKSYQVSGMREVLRRSRQTLFSRRFNLAF